MYVRARAEGAPHPSRLPSAWPPAATSRSRRRPAHGRRADGTTRVDVAGADDRAGNLVVVPDGGPIAVGSGKPTASNLHATVVTLAADARVVDRKLYDVGWLQP